MKKVCVVLLAVWISGCAVLTESQVKNINAFAATAKAYSDFPDILVRKLSELHVKTGLIQASAHRKDTANLNIAIGAIRNFEKSASSIADKFNLSLQLIQQYSNLLTKLSSDSYSEDLGKSTKALGDNLTGLIKTYNTKVSAKIPASVGSAISKAVLFIGKQLLKRKQTKALKDFLLAGNDLIRITLNNLKEVLDSDGFTATGISYPSMKKMIEEERKNFTDKYEIVIFSNASTPDYPAVKDYYETLKDYDNLEQARSKIVTSVGKFSAAYNKLIQNVQEKKNLKDIIQETQDFIKDAQDVFNTIKDLLK